MMQRAFLIISFVVAVCLPNGVLVTAQGTIDCGTDEEVELNVVGSVEEQEIMWYEVASKEFMAACPNVTISFVDTTQFEDDFSGINRLEYYMTAFEFKNPTLDVVQINLEWSDMLADYFLDLTSYLSDEQVEAFFPSLIETSTVDGRLVALPWKIEVGVLYYRTDLLEKYNLDVPKTWDDLEVAATTIQDGERAKGNDEFWGYVWQTLDYETLTANALEWQASEGGGTLLGKDGEIEVNNEETIRAFARAARWIGTITPPVDELRLHEETARQFFQTGNSAFMRNWPYAYEVMNEDDSPIKGLFDIAPLPQGATGNSTGVVQGAQLAVSRYSLNPSAAAAFVAFLASPEQQAIQQALNPTIMALYEDETILDANPYYDTLFEIYNSTDILRKPISVAGPLYGEVSKAYFKAVYRIIQEDADPTIEMEKLEIDIQDILAE